MALSSFIGRDRSLDELRACVDEGRLVTVIGPAGAGKTRLARELLAGDGVFVDLVDVRSREELRARVATAFGVQLVGDDDGPLIAALAAHTAAPVVLDNVEQVARDAAELISVWMADTDARLIVTSRVRLGIQGERLFDVEPLALADACELFCQRARAVRRDFVADDAQRALVERIVHKLEGLPLAIELAAARMRVLSLNQLNDQLTKRVDVLSAGDRSMRGAFDTSWELLEPWLRRALTQATVFRGGFTFAAAQAVLDVGDHDALDAIQALCEQSLLNVHEASDSAARYRLYESVRVYAAERVEDSAALAERHADYFARLCSDSGAGDLTLELDNLIDAHRQSLAVDAGRALALATAIDPLIKRCGPMELRITLLDRALSAADEVGVDSSQLIDGLLARADAAAELSRFTNAERDQRRALALARATEDVGAEARSLAALGRLAWHAGDIDEAESLFEDALPLFEDAGDAEGSALTLLTTANVYTLRGDVDAARSSYERVLELLRASGQRPDLLALGLGNLANLEQNVDELEAAESHLEQAIATAQECGERYYESTFLLHLAIAAFSRHHLDRATEICQRALKLQQELGNRRWEGVSLAVLAEIEEARDDVVAARLLYEKSVSLLREFGHPMLEGMALCKLARVEAHAGRIDVAQRRLGRARDKLDGDNPLAALVDVCAAEIARCAGDIDEARELAASAVPAARQSWEVRWALARLSGALPPAQGPQLSVGPEARWFELADKRTDLSRRRALRLVFEALLGADAPLSIDALLAAGWPGEAVSTEAGQSRVYTAVATLRRMGLRDVLLRRDDGYLLDPRLRIDRRD